MHFAVSWFQFIFGYHNAKSKKEDIVLYLSERIFYRCCYVWDRNCDERKKLFCLAPDKIDGVLLSLLLCIYLLL